MNLPQPQAVSVYKLTLGVQAPSQPLLLTPATLLSYLRALVDFLIEREIAATLLIKLPPGKIWSAEIERYISWVKGSRIVNFCTLTPYSPPPVLIQREYFAIALSPEFCSLVVAKRPLPKRKTRKLSLNKSLQLLTANSFEGAVIGKVIANLKQIPNLESLISPKADFSFPSVTEPLFINQILTKQLQRQDEIQRQIVAVRLAKQESKQKKLQVNLQAKDEYLNNVCQELRTHLTHMKPALSLLNSPNIKPPQRQRYLQMLQLECDRQNSIINGVLDLAELESNLKSPVFEAVKLSDIVPGVVSTYQPLAQEKGIMLAYTVPTDIPAIWCIAGGLKQIVIHLLSNSIKFTPNGGEVWVRSRIAGDRVQLEVRDTGTGIGENDITKIFDRFYRVRPTSIEDPGGAGLGLTVVQLLLSRCGGSISVKSKPSLGSTFTVNLAIASPAEK